MLGAQLGEQFDRLGAAIVGQRARNDFERVRRRTIRPLLDAAHRLGLGLQRDRRRHLGGAAARHEARFAQNRARHGERVVEIALELVEDVLARAAQQHRARLQRWRVDRASANANNNKKPRSTDFGIDALLEEGKVLVAELAHLHQAAARADVVGANLVAARLGRERRRRCSGQRRSNRDLRAMNDRGAAGARQAIRVGLAHATKGGDAGLDEEVLRQIAANDRR